MRDRAARAQTRDLWPTFSPELYQKNQKRKRRKLQQSKDSDKPPPSGFDLEQTNTPVAPARTLSRLEAGTLLASHVPRPLKRLCMTEMEDEISIARRIVVPRVTVSEMSRTRFVTERLNH